MTDLDPELQQELDELLADYKKAVDDWVAAIREEEAVASNSTHSVADLDKWEQAHFRGISCTGKSFTGSAFTRTRCAASFSAFNPDRPASHEARCAAAADAPSPACGRDCGETLECRQQQILIRGTLRRL
jgi:hypothetical protein